MDIEYDLRSRSMSENKRNNISMMSSSPLRKSQGSPLRDSSAFKKSVTFVPEENVNVSTPVKKTNFEVSRFGHSLEKTAEKSFTESPMRSTYKSPITQDIEEQTVRCLRDQITYEKDLETAKCTLAMRPDFNLFDAFKIFDVRQLG